MMLADDCGWALLRAAGIALAAVVVAGLTRDHLASASRRRGRLLWALHLVPFLTPAALVGYAWSRFSLSLIRHAGWNQALYWALLWLKLTPVATLALYFAPSPIAPEALHSHRLLGRLSARRLLSAVGFWLRGPGRAAAVGFALVFLLAFGEFEMASLLTIDTWPVALFDAQVGGLSLLASLRLALPALACEAGLLLLALAVLLSTREPPRATPPRHRRPRWPARVAVWLCLAVALVAVTGVPLFVVLRGTIRGLRLMAETLALSRDVAASIGFALGGAALAYLLAGWFLRTVRRGGGWRKPLAGAFVLCVPGLLGPLLLGLLLMAAFQVPGLRLVYGTALPLLLALGLLLLPFALLLRALLAVTRPGEAVHAASLLAVSAAPDVAQAARRTVWEMRRRGLFWVAFLLFWWAYFELAASALLAPPAMTPVLVRLYNFMHYGQTSVLSAMVCVACAVPFLVLGAWALARHAVQWAMAR